MIMEDYSRMNHYYTKRDGLLALGVFIVSSLLFLAAGFILRSTGMRLFIHASIVSVTLVLIVILIRKDEVRSIGISFKNMWKSALCGLLTGAAFFFSMRLVMGASLFERAYGGVDISNRLGGNRFHHVLETPLLEWLPMAFVFLLITVVHQEILMRGYVQTRLYGLFKSEWAAVIITGFLFVVFFMPLNTILFGENISWIFLESIPTRMLWMFSLHCWLYLLYRLYNNWAGPVIFHIFFSFHSNITLVHSYVFGIG